MVKKKKDTLYIPHKFKKMTVNIKGHFDMIFFKEKLLKLNSLKHFEIQF